MKREDIFVTSKLAATRCTPDEVEKGLTQTLNDLGLDYLDLYLIHQPISVTPNPNHDEFVFLSYFFFFFFF